MKVLGHVHGYPPIHNAGAEWALHGILADLVDRHGYDVTVAVARPPRGRQRPPATVDGVNVRYLRSWRDLVTLYSTHDVAITHLDVTARAVALARRTGTPLAHYVHNHLQLGYHDVDPDLPGAELVVWNSAWLADMDWPGRTVIVNPPVWPEWYPRQAGTHDAAVFVNPLPAKGAATVWALADAQPERRFVVVAGGYGSPDTVPDLPNIDTMPNHPGLTRALAAARVVLMPSHYESWGRVAIEAACGGIPSICARTPGLMEAGVAFDYVDHDDVGGWACAIDRLDDAATYAQASDDAAGRALFLAAAARSQIDDLAAAFVDLAG